MTEKKQYDALVDELQTSKSFLKAILNSTYYGIASYEAIRDASGAVVDFRITFTNAEVPGNFGLKIEDVVHKKCSEIYPGIFKNGIFEKMTDVLTSGQSGTYEISVPVDGKIMWLTAAIEKVNDSVTITSKNITPEKETAINLERMNELLAENEALLEQKNNRLQSQNEALASFNYVASHDLQEPLRKIRMFTSRILEAESGTMKETSMAHFESISNTAERMQNLINDLLAYSAMDSENLTTEKTSLNTILNRVLASLEDTFESRQVVFKTVDLPVIDGIPDLLEQLFANIIINAVKYSKAEVPPVILLSSEKIKRNNEAFYKIAFTDNGIGFEPEYKEKIFEVFQRLHGKKEYSGTGVGLAICKKIMQYHNGFISAESIPGSGAVFSMFFPVGASNMNG